MLNLDYLARKKTDRLIKGWIIGTLSEEILSQVIGIDYAIDVWTALSLLLESFSLMIKTVLDA